MFTTPFIVAAALILSALAALGIVRANLKICQPNEVLIFSGRKRLLTDGGQRVGDLAAKTVVVRSTDRGARM